MGELRVRNVDEAVVLEFKERARRHGTSLEAELRSALTEEATRPRREWSEQLASMRESIRSQYGTMPDSAAFIRADRDAE
jgi:plasmid stability protein